jgi:cytochrome c oxidase assembly protein subunit 15
MVVIPFPTELRTRSLGRSRRVVRIWLLFLIVLVFAMVLVGGATRLTESGLSITEWKPLSGAIPPLSAAAWQEAFDQYRQSPQYALVNQGMTLTDYRTIFWWEWAHRELGRLIGLVFLGGLLWTLARRRLPGQQIAVLVLMGALLGAQGLVGWIMVASGLKPGMTAVEPLKLTLHLLLACLFFAGLVAAYIGIGGGANREAAPRAALWTARIAVVFAFVQLAFGGLMAGHHAGLTYNTWPLMDGSLVPEGLGMLRPAWTNLVDNVTTIQFDHRIGAYALLLAILIAAIQARKVGPDAARRGLVAAGLALAQVGLGIATLIAIVPLHLALAHQGIALVLLLSLIWNASVLRSSGS